MIDTTNLEELGIHLPISKITGVLNEATNEVECCIDEGLFTGIRYNLSFDDKRTDKESMYFQVDVKNKADLYKYAEKLLEYIITKDMYRRINRK